MNAHRPREWFDNDGFWRASYPFTFPDKRFAERAAQIGQALELAKSQAVTRSRRANGGIAAEAS